MKRPAAPTSLIIACALLTIAFPSAQQPGAPMTFTPTQAASGRVVYDGPSAALTPALLRELYGAEADEILALGDHIGSLQEPQRAPAPRPWQPQALPQAA